MKKTGTSRSELLPNEYIRNANKKKETTYDTVRLRT